MKKLNALLPLFLAAILAFWGCKKWVGANQTNKNTNKVVVKFDRSTAWQNMTAINMHSQKVFKMQDGLLVFIFSKDGKINALLSLIPENKADIQKLYNYATLQGANFLYSKNLLVIEKNSNRIYFVVDNKSGIQEAKKLKNSSVIKGIQLSLCLGKYNSSSLREIKNYKTVRDFFLSEAKSQTKCTSGGEGATNCSVKNSLSNCSVSCATGYYACCNGEANKCSCLKK